MARDATDLQRKQDGMAYTRNPGTPEEMLQNAAEIERATHHLALFVDAPDDRVREHPGPALIAALSLFPERQPLRRGKDQAIIYAMRVLARELPATYPRKNHIMMRLSALSRQACADHWPDDTWRDEGQG